MRFTPVRSRPLLPPVDDLYERLNEGFSQLPERAVVAVASKVVAIGEGRCIPLPADADVKALKHEYAIRESEYYLPGDVHARHPRFFSIVHGTLIGTAGIDESNGNGHLILWPSDPQQSAQRIRAHLMSHCGVRELGVIVTDSAPVPLRNGAKAIAIGHAGFSAVRDYRGTNDIFGRTLRSERLSIADSIAASAGLVMGEGNETTPFVLVEDIPHIEFTEHESSDPFLSRTVSREDDAFAPFFLNAPWKKGGRHT